MEVPQSYFAVLPVLSLPDAEIRADKDTAVAYPMSRRRSQLRAGWSAAAVGSGRWCFGKSVTRSRVSMRKQKPLCDSDRSATAWRPTIDLSFV